MPQSLSQVLVHAVFSTKDREPMIPTSVRPRLHAYLATVLKEMGNVSLQVGGTGDHIHALFALSRTVTLADTIQEMKTSSSQWMKEQMRCGFGWQSGYGTFSVAASQKRRVIQYIQTQESHHRVITFQDEFRTLLKRYEISWDERYVWD
jgi:REP element-mobilizing transposase RayT